MSDITAGQSPGPWSTTDFAIAVLRGLGAPTSQSNINFLLSWFAREGVNPAYNNPLATTLKYGNYSNINSVGVKHYSDPTTGVAATVKTLQGSHYAGIVTDLKADNAQGAAHNHPDEFKTWSGGGYDHIDIKGTALGTVTAPTTAGSTISMATGNTTLPAGATDLQVEQWIRENNPTMAGYLSVAELRPILIQAAKDEADGHPWTDGRLTAALSATNWWKNNSQTTRDFLLLKQTDPAAAEEQVRQKMADLAPRLEQEGSDVSLRAIAEAALTYGWTDQEVQDNLAGHAQYDLEHTGLKQGSTPEIEQAKLAAMARTEYYIPMDQQTLGQWAVDIYSGHKTEDQFRDYLSTLSESRFPGLKGKGITPSQYMSGIISTVANELEISPADVDPLSVNYSPLISMVGPDGNVRPMTQYEALQWARSQPQYRTTKGAMDQAASFATQLGTAFGAVAS